MAIYISAREKQGSYSSMHAEGTVSSRYYYLTCLFYHKKKKKHSYYPSKHILFPATPFPFKPPSQTYDVRFPITKYADAVFHTYFLKHFHVLLESGCIFFLIFYVLLKGNEKMFFPEVHKCQIWLISVQRYITNICNVIPIF